MHAAHHAGGSSATQLARSAADNDRPAATLAVNNLKDQLVDALRAAILTGQLSPGETYSAGELAEYYGASRTPVREALLELASKGLVEVIRGVGFRVMAPSDKEVVDVLRVRQALEAWAMQEIAGRLSPEAIETARRLVDDVARAAQANDIVEYWAADRAFHSFLTAQAGNRRLDTIVSELYDTQRIAVRAKLAAVGDLTERNRDHRALVDALAAGDGARAAEILSSHLERSATQAPDHSTPDSPPSG